MTDSQEKYIVTSVRVYLNGDGTSNFKVDTEICDSLESAESMLETMEDSVCKRLEETDGWMNSYSTVIRSESMVQLLDLEYTRHVYITITKL